MVRIRLRRIGAKRKPFYRIVVANQRSARNGSFIEMVGTYNPLTDPSDVRLKAERVKYWLGKGAQPSEPMLRILKTEGILDEEGAVADA